MQRAAMLLRIRDEFQQRRDVLGIRQDVLLAVVSRLPVELGGGPLLLGVQGHDLWEWNPRPR
jgi:hypothetical protein